MAGKRPVLAGTRTVLGTRDEHVLRVARASGLLVSASCRNELPTPSASLEELKSPMVLKK
jgi:hypothetical protein